MNNQSLSVVNAATKKPEVFVGRAANLEITLLNSGTAVKLSRGAQLRIFMPSYFTPADVGEMSIALTNWTFSRNPAIGELTLTYARDSDGTWEGPLTFNIANARSNASARMDSLQINPRNMRGVGAQFSKPLSLLKPAQAGNADLASVLQVSLDNRGTVYVSDQFDPLANTLFLNIKNVGKTALYTGSAMPRGAEISLGFTYGNTAGALAPAATGEARNQPLGSAWNIVPGITQDQTEGWVFAPPRRSDKLPIWRATPQATNKTLIGAGAHSNVTFNLSHIVALTPVGRTQMIISFSGFQKTETRNYDPLVLVLDISKQNAPPTRGLVNFFGTDAPLIPVAAEKTPITIPLRWTMANVAMVQLITGFPGVEPMTKVYAMPPKTPAPLDYDTGSVTLPGASVSESVTITLQARDAHKAFLNAMQYTVYLHMSVFVDPRDKQSYPIALFCGRFWMSANLNYEEPGSRAYNDSAANAKTYGRLYPANAQSLLNPPDGWRVPGRRDWIELIACLGGADSVYAELMHGGDGKFNGLLGGKYAPSKVTSDYADLLLAGYYWDAERVTYTSLHSQGRKVSPGGGTVAAQACYSIRYIKDV